MQTLAFDENYVNGLRNKNPEIETHFVTYFKMPVWNKARRRLQNKDLAEDAVQETLLRVLRYFRSGKTLNHPERLPAFVLSTCRNVTLEMMHDIGRNPQVSELSADPPDNIDLELDVVTRERQEVVRKVLATIPEKDRQLLQQVLEGADKDELCARLGVTATYLRVLLFRARKEFRARWVKRFGPVSH